jgi:phosphatidylglycerophosphatase A
MTVAFLPPARAGATARERALDVTAWVFSLWFGCGLVPRAPGTAGTIGALPIYWLARTQGLWGVGTAAVVITAAGIWSSSRVAKLSGLKDPQFVCVDEVAGVLVTWMGAPPGWQGTLVGLLLFRILDVVKPYPARTLERLPGGFGIVLDDVAAGLWGGAFLLALQLRGWL